LCDKDKLELGEINEFEYIVHIYTHIQVPAQDAYNATFSIKCRERERMGEQEKRGGKTQKKYPRCARSEFSIYVKSKRETTFISHKILRPWKKRKKNREKEGQEWRKGLRLVQLPIP